MICFTQDYNPKGRIPIFEENALNDKNCTGKMVSVEFFALMDAIERELEERKIVFIRPDLAGYLNRFALLGESVNKAFPSANDEIQDAGNCLAAELNTAAVFHLTRVAEHGLRALAKHFKAKKFKGQTALKYADWGTVIKAIKQQLEVLEQQQRGPKREELLKFGRRKLSDCEMLKDVWRNPVSHVRQRFSQRGALLVLDRIQEFMQELSKKVKE